MKEKFKILASILGSERVKFDEPLKYYLVNGIPLQAASFYIATTVKELVAVLNLVRELKIEYFLFGAGTKAFFSEESLKGLIIQNRTTGIKISGVKGKVSPSGIGVSEAMVEAESGVSINKLNDFLKDQKLKVLEGEFVKEATVGGSLSENKEFQADIGKIKIFQDGEVSDIDIIELKKGDVILSAVFKVKSAGNKI